MEIVSRQIHQRCSYIYINIYRERERERERQIRRRASVHACTYIHTCIHTCTYKATTARSMHEHAAQIFDGAMYRMPLGTACSVHPQASCRVRCPTSTGKSCPCSTAAGKKASIPNPLSCPAREKLCAARIVRPYEKHLQPTPVHRELQDEPFVPHRITSPKLGCGGRESFGQCAPVPP